MIVLYNTNYCENSNAYLTRSVLAGAERAFAGEDVVLARNETLMTIAAAGRIRVLICIDGQRLRADILKRVRPLVGTMILWTFEDPFMLEVNRAAVHLFDHVFTNDPECVGAYGERARFLPLAADMDQDFRPVRSTAELTTDIFFAGTMWPNRTSVVARLIERFGHKRLKLVCPTNEYLPPLPRFIADRSIERPVNHSSFIDFANRSRVTFTIFRDYTSGGGNSRANAPGPRYFENALAGSAQVVLLEPGMSSTHFDILPGCTICRRTEDAFEAVDALLADDDRRLALASQAQAAALSEHLYHHRLVTMSTTVGAAGARPIEPADASRRLRVLFCTHAIKTARHVGGIEHYQDTIGGPLAAECDLFYWLRTDDRCQLLDGDLQVLETFGSPAIGWLDVLSDPREETLFATVLSSYAIDVVHFQHLGHHAASLPLIAKALGLGVVFSVHDFFLVCSRYNLLDFQSRYCRIAERSLLACDTCLRIGENLPAGTQHARRAFMARVVDSVDMFLFGTRSSQQLLTAIYPRLEAERCKVVGIVGGDEGAMPIGDDRLDLDKGLAIGIYGNVLRSKGADCLLRVIDALKGSTDYTFYVYGKADDHYAAVLRGMNGGNVRFFDGYSNADVARLARCDVALFLSIWPETFSIALTEAWRAGAIPIASKLGAFADRIEDGVNGFLVTEEDDAAVVALLQRLRFNPSLVGRMRHAARTQPTLEKTAHVAQLLSVYRRYAPSVRFDPQPVRIDVGQIGLQPQASWKTQAPPRHILEHDDRKTYALSSALVGETIVFGDARFFLDGIGGRDPRSLDDSGDGFPLPASISGWMYTSSVEVAGKLQVAFVAEEIVIFVDCERSSRMDVVERFSQAPEYCGFSTVASFRGRWSDGLFQVALVNAVAGRTIVVPLELGVRLQNGLIVDVVAEPASPAIRSFLEQRLRGKAAPMPGSRDILSSPIAAGVPQVVLEEVRRVAPDGAAAVMVRGWFYHPALCGRDAAIYVGIESAEGVVFKRTKRLDRADVKQVLGIGELKTGFNERVELPPGGGAQHLHVVLSDWSAHSRAVFKLDHVDASSMGSERVPVDVELTQNAA